MENFELELTTNGMNGEGIARKDGKVYFVNGAIEGEVVLCKMVQENKKFAIADAIKIIKSCNERCVPKCKYFEKCGGCDMQHITYEKQLEIKRQNVQNLFDKNKLNFKISNCVKSENQFEYRNKLTLYFNNNSLCFYKKNSKEYVEINKCLLVDKNFNYLIKKFNEFFKENKEYSFILKGLSIRQINDIFIINLLIAKKLNFKKLENMLKLNKINYSLFYCLNSNKNSNIFQYPCHFIGGEKNALLCENNITYPIYPMSFLQVNDKVKKQLYEKVLSFVSGFDLLLDAYSGAGLLSAMLSKQNNFVYAVEIDKSASLASENLCKENKIYNMKSICGDCAVELPKLLKNNKFDCIVLDPARSGVDVKILNSILQFNVDDIIYISCNPATLCRDLKILTDKYEIEYAEPYDMFPQTSNVEMLVKLNRRKQ